MKSIYLTGLTVKEYHERIVSENPDCIDELHKVKDWEGEIPRVNEILRPDEPTYEYEFYIVDKVLYDMAEGIVVLFLFNPLKEMKRNENTRENEGSD